MSEISRAAPSAPKPATAPANRGPGGKANEEQGAVFSALLSLVAETRSAPAGEASAGGSGADSDDTENDAQDPAQGSSDSPVAQLLGWVDPRPSTGGVTPTGVADPAQAALEATATATTAAATITTAFNTADVAADTIKAGGTGIDITGMQPLATPEAIDPPALLSGPNSPAGQAVGAASPAPSHAPAAPTSSAPRDTKTSAAANATQPNATGANITGMQPLATPKAMDPAALPPGTNTAAGRPTGTGAPALGDAQDARTSGTRRNAKISTTADTTASLRAPAATWQPLTNASARGAGVVGGSDTLRGRGATWTNSTVSMDLNATREADSMAGNAVSLTARLSAMLAGQAQADGAAPTPMLGATQEAGASPAEKSPAADLLASGEATPDTEPPPLSHWSTQHLRHAHLRLGEGALDSVDIRLSMQGQDLSVDFRTDNADIRQSLAQQANQSLASLLERSGIALADVSVGAQQQQRQPQGQGSEPQRGGATAQASRGVTGRAEADPLVATHTPTAQTLRADGSRPLDLFV